ncbi:hypothetical protein JCM16303_003950 [Sporobolomyces ruberrimus]
MGWNFREFGSTHFDTLLNLLSSTRLEQLGFTSVGQIFLPEPASQLLSVKVLRLSGTCTFRDKTVFAAFHRFLSGFPSLTQLHLVGQYFFDDSPIDDSAMIRQNCAHAMSRLEPIPLAFQYAELSTLLLYLRTTRVKIFTYRGDQEKGEKREMRWTRLNETDDFDADCWTL